jgi:hypothetical protein
MKEDKQTNTFAQTKCHSLEAFLGEEIIIVLDPRTDE